MAKGNKIAEFKRLMQKKAFDQVPIQTMWAIVKEVDWGAKTMDVLVDDLEVYDVLLGLGNEYKKPTIGSKCLIGIIENKQGAFLLHASSVSDHVIKIEPSILTVTENGFSIKKGSESLKTVLGDFIDEVNKIVVIEGRTIDVAAVTQIKQRLNNILTT
jgi:hypothetical protein